MTEFIYCPYCGAKNASTNRFCENCGQKLVSEFPSTAQQSTSGFPSYEQQVSKGYMGTPPPQENVGNISSSTAYRPIASSGSFDAMYPQPVPKKKKNTTGYILLIIFGVIFGLPIIVTLIFFLIALFGVMT